MTAAQVENLLIYVGIWCAIALAGALGLAIGAGAVVGFEDGQVFAPARAQVAGALALLVSGGGVWLAANRPRFGSEGLAADVGAYRELGYHRADLTVVPKGGRAPDPALVTTTVMLTDAQLKQVTDELVPHITDALEARLRATPAVEGGR